MRDLWSLKLAQCEHEGVHGRLDQGKRIMVEASRGRFASLYAVLRVASTAEARPIPDRHIERRGRRSIVFYEHISHSSKDVARARRWRGYSTRLSVCQSVGRRRVKRRRTLSRTNEGRELAEHVGYYGGPSDSAARERAVRIGTACSEYRPKYISECVPEIYRTIRGRTWVRCPGAQSTHC